MYILSAPCYLLSRSCISVQPQPIPAIRDDPISPLSPLQPAAHIKEWASRDSRECQEAVSAVLVAIRSCAARIRRNCPGASIRHPCMPSHPRPWIIEVAGVVFRTARTMPDLSSHPPAPAPARTSSRRNSCLIAFLVHRQNRQNRQNEQEAFSWVAKPSRVVQYRVAHQAIFVHFPPSRKDWTPIIPLGGRPDCTQCPIGHVFFPLTTDKRSNQAIKTYPESPW